MRLYAGTRAPGFTLVEVLVCLTLITLVMWTGYSALRLGARVWEVGDVRSSAAEDLRIGAGFLRGHLARAVGVSISDGGRDWTLEFEGGPESLRFLTEVPPFVGDGGLQEVVVAITGDGDGDDYRISVQRRQALPGLDQSDGDAAGEDRVLVGGLARARLDYFGAPDPRDNPEWRGDWRGARSLPQLVRLTVETSEAGSWPPLVFPVRANVVRNVRDAPGSGEPSSVRDAQDAEDELDSAREADGRVAPADGRTRRSRSGGAGS